MKTTLIALAGLVIIAMVAAGCRSGQVIPTPASVKVEPASSTDWIPTPIPTKEPKAITVPKTTTAPAAPSQVYYANCTAAKRAGAAPIYRGEPGYRAALDRDNDGVACE